LDGFWLREWLVVGFLGFGVLGCGVGVVGCEIWVLGFGVGEVSCGV